MEEACGEVEAQGRIQHLQLFPTMHDLVKIYAACDDDGSLTRCK